MARHWCLSSQHCYVIQGGGYETQVDLGRSMELQYISFLKLGWLLMQPNPDPTAQTQIHNKKKKKKNNANKINQTRIILSTIFKL